jgi:type I restriction enzyme S subunit
MWSWWRDVFMNFSELVAPNGLFSDGDWIEKKDQDENGTVRLIQLADIGACFFKDKSAKFVTEAKAKELNCTYLQKGDILIARLPDPLGRACIFSLDGKYITAVDVAIVRISRSDINPKYVMYMINSPGFRNDIKHYESGTTRKRISRKNLDKIQFNIPPLPEQEHIISRIEELFSQLDASVAELKTAKERLNVYRQAVLKEAFDSCKDFVPLATLGDLGRGKSKHRPRNDAALFENGKYPFIQTGEVKAAPKHITCYSKMYGDFGLQQSKLWPKGTLCITIAANIAETAFLGIDACFPDSVVGFTPYEHILPEYVRYFIESQKQRLWAFAPATAQKNINLDTLEKLTIPYCSVEEQEQIVRKIDSKKSVCDSIEKTVDTALQQAEALRQSILKKAFEGGLM